MGNKKNVGVILLICCLLLSAMLIGCRMTAAAPESVPIQTEESNSVETANTVSTSAPLESDPFELEMDDTVYTVGEKKTSLSDQILASDTDSESDKTDEEHNNLTQTEPVTESTDVPSEDNREDETEIDW